MRHAGTQIGVGKPGPETDPLISRTGRRVDEYRWQVDQRAKLPRSNFSFSSRLVIRLATEQHRFFSAECSAAAFTTRPTTPDGRSAAFTSSTSHPSAAAYCPRPNAPMMSHGGYCKDLQGMEYNSSPKIWNPIQPGHRTSVDRIASADRDGVLDRSESDHALPHGTPRSSRRHRPARPARRRARAPSGASPPHHARA